MSKSVNIKRHGLTVAVREHLASGQPITRLEALVLYGVANLPAVVKEMRDQGWVIQSRWIPYATAVRRINEHAVLQPPANLPVREIQLTEYWLNKLSAASRRGSDECWPGSPPGVACSAVNP